MSIPKLLLSQGIAKPLRWQQQVWLADARYSLFWPSERLLVVSDLHFGKAQALNYAGNQLPELDSLTTLQRLEALLQEYQPHTLIALGDSFHNERVAHGLPERERQLLCRLCLSVPNWVWLLGNHDVSLPQHWPGQYLPDIEIKGIRFGHEPGQGKPEVIGHFHPKTSVRLAGQKLTGKVFILDEQRLIMPAFGAFTGGLAVADPAISGLLAPANMRQFLCYNKKIYALDNKV